jgi:hypothetical protein
MQGQFGHHELVEAHPFGFRFAGQGGVKGFGDADIKLTAVFPPLWANRRFRKAVDQLIELAAFFRLGKGGAIPGTGKQACKRPPGAVDRVVRFDPGQARGLGQPASER